MSWVQNTGTVTHHHAGVHPCSNATVQLRFEVLYAVYRWLMLFEICISSRQSPRPAALARLVSFPGAAGTSAAPSDTRQFCELRVYLPGPPYIFCSSTDAQLSVVNMANIHIVDISKIGESDSVFCGSLLCMYLLS